MLAWVERELDCYYQTIIKKIIILSFFFNDGIIILSVVIPLITISYV